MVTTSVHSESSKISSPNPRIEFTTSVYEVETVPLTYVERRINLAVSLRESRRGRRGVSRHVGTCTQAWLDTWSIGRRLIWR